MTETQLEIAGGIIAAILIIITCWLSWRYGPKGVKGQKTTFTVSSGSNFKEGMQIKVGGKLLKVISISGNTLEVEPI